MSGPPASAPSVGEFFAALYPDMEAHERIEIRAIAPSGHVGQRFVPAIDEAVEAAEALSPHQNVYYGVGLRDGNGGSKENTTRIGAAYADVDWKLYPDGKKGAHAALSRFPLRPSIVVASGGGYQALWLSKELLGKEDFSRLEAVNRALTFALAPPGKRLDAAIDVSRVLRAPGTWNHKAEYGSPRPVRIVGWHPERRYDLSDLEEWLPVEAVGGDGHADIEGWDGVEAERVLHQALARLGHAEAGRLIGMLNEPDAYLQRFPSQSEADFAAVSILVKAGLEDAEIVAVWRACPSGRREKTHRRDDYIARTLAAARAHVRRNGERGNFTSAYKEVTSEVKFEREVNARALQASAREKGAAALDFLPVLGQEGYLVRCWSHLIASYPKAGKTELLVRVIAEWPNERVLYFTEEPRGTWEARLARLPDVYSNVTLVFALGLKPEDILAWIQAGTATVVIIDTIRNLLGLEDEKDNSEVARALVPFIAACRAASKTPIFLHHERKTGGEHGRGIAGAGAFLGVVDIALELQRDQQVARRRLLRGLGRVIEIPEMLYELAEDGTMMALGSPKGVALEDARRRGKGALEAAWKTMEPTDQADPKRWPTTTKVLDQMGDPKPSRDQMGEALQTLAEAGEIQRDPPISEGKKQGATYRWTPNFTSDGSPYKAEVKLEEVAEWTV